MGKIRQITISGFRGILTPLNLNFEKANNPVSMVIYGSNGTGKSSITDAWEWFRRGKIEHLAREGARYNTYPHTDSEPGDTFIEVQFKDPDLEEARLEFDRSRVTQPKEEGQVEEFRKKVPHPCHIRFDDLKEFVYKTKTKKYEALSRLMGFTPQMELQKSLNRVKRKLQDMVGKHQDKVDDSQTSLKEMLEISEINEETFLDVINKILKSHEIEVCETTEELFTSLEGLRGKVENDPRAQELTDLTNVKETFDQISYPKNFEHKIEQFLQALTNFLAKKTELIELHLIDLYRKAEEIINQFKEKGKEVEYCPLCRQKLEDIDLSQHIEDELGMLKELKTSYEEVSEYAEGVQEDLERISTFSGTLENCRNSIQLDTERWGGSQIVEALGEMEEKLPSIQTILSKSPANMNNEDLVTIEDHLKEIRNGLENYGSLHKELLSRVEGSIKELKENEIRKQIVEDFELFSNALKYWKDLRKKKGVLNSLKKVADDYREIVKKFVDDSLDKVQSKFELVSSDVASIFNILEQRADYLSDPSIKLLLEENRAVTLKVQFRGDSISPAFKYLSESQMNSFGLAVFLASAKHFNPEFNYIILDDVINSFDAYKRPQVIEVIKQHFSEHQFLIMTHDRIWSNRLFKEFNNWNKVRFTRYESAGPIKKPGYTKLEDIKHHLRDDEVRTAGQMLGPYLEKEFQELCEAFEAMVKYNQKNEYTLAHILDRFRVRVRSKLGSHNNLYQLLSEMKTDSFFRNFVAHWKNPETPFTRSEVHYVVEKWEEIEDFVRCDEEDCSGYLQYDGSGSFKCRCGATVLE